MYISQLIHFTRASGCVADFSTRGELLTERLLGQGCRCRRLCKAFSWFWLTLLWFGVWVPGWAWVSLAPEAFEA